MHFKPDPNFSFYFFDKESNTFSEFVVAELNFQRGMGVLVKGIEKRIKICL